MLVTAPVVSTLTPYQSPSWLVDSQLSLLSHLAPPAAPYRATRASRWPVALLAALVSDSCGSAPLVAGISGTVVWSHDTAMIIADSASRVFSKLMAGLPRGWGKKCVNVGWS